MLVVLFGVSGSGRTTTINTLCECHGWKRIRIYTTREVRISETESKIPISDDTFHSMSHCGYFALETHVYNNKYGFCKEDIDSSLTSDIPWIMDFALSNINMLDRFPYKGVLIRPESREILHSRILNTERHNRIKEILSRYDHEDTFIKEHPAILSKIIINKFGSLEQTISQMLEVVKE